MKTIRLFLLGVIFTAANFAAAAPSLPEGLADFDAYVARVQKEFNVPGIAVAIVKDGEVVLTKGYGVREAGKPERVDEHTLFAIASNTKAFTSASLAILMDEGKVSWNDRVVDHLPWFQMSDAVVTREMTVQDLLVHRSGLSLGAGDLLFWPATTYSTREVAERLRHVPLTTSFRSAYAYDNILYAVAGLTIEQVSGKTWAQFVRERIFAPVGMKETKTNCSELAPDDNVAIGHAKYDWNYLRPVSAMAWDNNSAAGGIYSSVSDMAKWVNVQLAGGILPDGKMLFSEQRQEEMWAVVTPMKIGPPAVPSLALVVPNFSGYGHGWVLADYQGKKLVSHTGGWPGQVSKVAMIPELKLGVIVLTNQEVGAAFQAITWRVLDAFMKNTPTDWVAAYAEAVEKSRYGSMESWMKHFNARDRETKPSLTLAKYAGIYRDIWYGDVSLVEKDGRLVMQFAKTEQLLGDLEHWQHDTFIVRWRDRSLNADAFVTFALTPDGAVESAKMEAVSPLTDFSFDFHDLKLKRVEK